jgi:hypothetical protein
MKAPIKKAAVKKIIAKQKPELKKYVSKDFLKKNFSYIIIAALVVIVLLQRSCSPTPNNPGDIVKICGKKYEVVSHEIDTVETVHDSIVFKKGKDIYTEFTSIDLEPEDPTRTLYKWRFNPHYEEEYDKTDPAPNGHFRYLIPISELIKVEFEKPSEAPTGVFPDFDEIMDPNNDAPLSQITVRDLAAIMLKKPVSQKKWLNDLISK